MGTINIVRGDFYGERWGFEKNKLQNGIYNVKEIPIEEVIKLTKLDVTKKETLVEILLSDGKSFISSMNAKTYDSFYAAFVRNGNNPRYVDLPILKKSKSNVAWAVFSLVFIFSLFNIN